MITKIQRRNGRFYQVRKSKIIGTSFECFEVVEPLGRHSTVNYSDQVGWLVTRRLPANLDKLPAFSPERMRRVANFHRRLDALHSLVLKKAGLHLEK